MEGKREMGTGRKREIGSKRRRKTVRYVGMDLPTQKLMDKDSIELAYYNRVCDEGK